MSFLYLLPVGSPEESILSGLELKLQEIFLWKIQRGTVLPVPQWAFNTTRNQYEALYMMRAIAENVPAEAVRVLAVTDVDLSIPMLTFVFGQAQLNGKIAMMSLARLKQEFYGMPENIELCMDRANKEALHELGHTFGLVHCPTKQCVMALANTIQHVDEKENFFCGGCRTLLQDSIRQIV